MRVGSLFTGYGGLDLAIGGELAWYSEIEPAACKVLAAHHPTVANLGDITAVNWDEIEPVDVITGGYPCQPFSSAGLRKGKDDERHLWPFVRDAISNLRPRLAILENVRGHITLGLTDVITDLARIGYDARWSVVRAADAGAPHSRARVFITAYPTSTGLLRPDLALYSGTGGDTPTRLAAPNSDATCFRWGRFQPAISRWELYSGRPAPTPVIDRGDRKRLNPVFLEWLMGLPEGWVTGHGLTPSQEIKMLGNGVCPPQAVKALRFLLGDA